MEKKPEAKPVEKPAEPAAPSAAACDNDDARRITQFLAGLLEHMECKAEIKVYEEEKNRYKVILEGQRLGALIGRRGETLDAIQQLTNYAVNSGRDKRLRIHVDAENYRAKRVIHAALQDKAGVTTYSVGTEPNRRVVVAYDRGNR